MIMKASEVKYIVIHCSATRSNSSYSALQLDLDHRARGFRMAGYHFYVSCGGEITPMRALNERGAHVRGFNHCSIGVCYEGGLRPNGQPADTRTPLQRTALRALVSYLREKFPTAVVVGHRDLSPDSNGDGVINASDWLKACPSFDAMHEYSLPPRDRAVHPFVAERISSSLKNRCSYAE